MAAGAWRNWAEGELVTEALFQDIQDSIAFIYASESAANSALTSKVEGTQFYDTTADQLKIWNGSAWKAVGTGKILQVVTADDATDTSYTGTGPHTLGSLSVSITPSATSSKILLTSTVNLSIDSDRYWYIGFKRDSTQIGLSDQATGSQTNAFVQPNLAEITDLKYQTLPTTLTYVDSPSSTSAITYTVCVGRYVSNTIFYNRPHTVADAGYSIFTRSTIQAFEIGA